jgi:hypothetical protein
MSVVASNNELQELDDALFYFVPGKVASHFHCETPSLDEAAYVANEALLSLFVLTYAQICSLECGFQGFPVACQCRIPENQRWKSRHPRHLQSVHQNSSCQNGQDITFISNSQIAGERTSVRNV